MASGGKTQQSTQTSSNITQIDRRVGVSDDGRAIVGDGNTHDESTTIIDASREDNSRTDNSVTINNSLDPLIAGKSLDTAQTVLRDAIAAGERSQAGVIDAAQENARISAQLARDTLAASGDLTGQILDVVNGIATRAQSESSAARQGANETISKVLSFQTAGDTQVAGDLIKYGAGAAALIAVALIFSRK